MTSKPVRVWRIDRSKLVKVVTNKFAEHCFTNKRDPDEAWIKEMAPLSIEERRLVRREVKEVLNDASLRSE